MYGSVPEEGPKLWTVAADEGRCLRIEGETTDVDDETLVADYGKGKRLGEGPCKQYISTVQFVLSSTSHHRMEA